MNIVLNNGYQYELPPEAIAMRTQLLDRGVDAEFIDRMLTDWASSPSEMRERWDGLAKGFRSLPYAEQADLLEIAPSWFLPKFFNAVYAQLIAKLGNAN